MNQELFFNILTFNWPQKTITCYFSTTETPNSYPVHHSKFPDNIATIFPEITQNEITKIYTTFEHPQEQFLPLPIDFNNKNHYLYKELLNRKIKRFFKETKNILVTKNFVNDRQIWIKTPQKDQNITEYEKFTLKIQFAKVSPFPELILSYDDTAKVLNQSIEELLEQVPPTLFKKVIHNNTLIHYQKAPLEVIQQIDLSQTYPLTSGALKKAVGITTTTTKTTNRYIKYKKAIDAFANEYLFQDDFKSIIPLNVNNFIEVPEQNMGKVNEACNDLVFKDGVIGRIPKLDFPTKKALARPIHRNIEIFFIFHESHKDVVNKLHKHLKNGTGKYYKGLQDFASIPYHLNTELSIKFTDIENPIPEIKEKLKNYTFNNETTYAGIYISPYDKHFEDKAKRKIYYQVKEELLKRKIVSQVIDYNKLKSKIDNYQYELNNISLALLAKLQGKPWQLSVATTRELVIGIGAFRNIDENIQYIASAFSFQNNGTFNSFDYFTKSDTVLLSGAICNAIEEFVAIEQNPDKVVIHFYKEMSQKEIRPIVEKMKRLKLGCPLFIININKTDAEDIMAYDSNWSGRLMPKSGTFIKIGWNQFLLFNNSRYHNTVNYSDTDSYPFPIKLSMSSPNEGALDEYITAIKLIEQVYQFSRLYWKSLRQQNVPITIKYPEMVAEIAPHFSTASIPSHGKEILWFL